MANLIATLQARGLVVDALARPEARRIFELWCDTFLQGVQQRTRQFRHRGLHWHAFSDGIVAAVEREEALDRYRRTAAEPVWILPESWARGCGVRCVGSPPPDLTLLREDLYVMPESMAWTMVFTHEQPDHGPYLTRREWCRVEPRPAP